VRKTPSAFHLVLSAVCVLGFFGSPAYAQDKDKGKDKDETHTNGHPNGIVQDWSRRHVVYSRIGPIGKLIAVQRDPRALLGWQAAERKDWRRARDRRLSSGTSSGLNRDWSISLGGGTTAAAMYPAKFTFDVNANPTCVAGIGVPIPDFVVFPVNATGLPVITATGTVTNGSATVPITAGTITPPYVGQPIAGVGIPAGDTIATATGNPATSITLAAAATAGAATSETLTISGQPNIVGFNNLYSGGTSLTPTGLCGSRASVAGDDRSSATTMWSYNVTAAGGQVPTSPALSLDGTKVAFVESASGATAHFHVLAWASGDGVDTTTPNAQNVLEPKTIVAFTDPVAPAAGTGTASDLALVPSSGLASNTLSSPFIDYNSDKAYIGNDSGTLFRVKDVFCTRNPACAGVNPPSPSLDLTWNGTGILATGCTGVLTGAVVDGGTGNIFVGCSDGNLYGFTPTGGIVPGYPFQVGDGAASTPTGGIVDPPLVDVVFGFVYAASGSFGGASGHSVLVQARTAGFTSLDLPITATLGAARLHNLHAPDFNDAYFSLPFNGAVPNVQGNSFSGTTTTGNTSNWQIYDWADSGTASNLATVYGVGFASDHTMTPGPAANFFGLSGSVHTEWSPVTEFLNGANDQLFVSALEGVASPNIFEYIINTAPNAFPPPGGATASEGNGTSGIIVDNDANTATFPQASSVYFGVLGSNTAVKLTQSGLL
jgi:hypothetical protein